MWLIFFLPVKGVFNSYFTMDKIVCKHRTYYVFNHRHHPVPQSKSNLSIYPRTSYSGSSQLHHVWKWNTQQLASSPQPSL